MDFNGKTALVTGGTKGIGFAIADALAKAGANVFVCSRTREEVEEAVQKLGENAAGKLCDVRVEEQVKGAIDSCGRRFGGVDILINNAGIGIIGKTVEEMS